LAEPVRMDFAWGIHRTREAHVRAEARECSVRRSFASRSPLASRRGHRSIGLARRRHDGITGAWNERVDRGLHSRERVIPSIGYPCRRTQNAHGYLPRVGAMLNSARNVASLAVSIVLIALLIPLSPARAV